MSDTIETRVSVVIVSHFSEDVIIKCLLSLSQNLEIILVDNASLDNTLSAARLTRADLQVRVEAVNRGFGAACNIGIEASAREFVLLLNPDARISAEALEHLVKAADQFPDAAILGPAIVNGDGRSVRSWDVSHRRRRSLARHRDGEPWPSGPICVEFLSGACMLLRRAEGLRFDESFFLYFEDDDLCATARAAGRSLMFVPEATVTHAGGRSSRHSANIEWRKATNMAWSRLRYVEKHYGAAAAKIEARRQIGRHLSKAVGHAILLRHCKLRADIAALSGTIAWLRGQDAPGTANRP